jgi:predicted solute-binding protein
MSEESTADIHQRLLSLENEVKSLKESKSEQANSNEKAKKEKKEKKPRAQTEYNKFVSAYINEQKEKLGEKFNHKVAFGEAAKRWTEKKEQKEQKK